MRKIADEILGKDLSENEKEKVFHLADKNRDFELNLYWQRSAYFIVFTGMSLMATYSKDFCLTDLQKLCLVFFASFSSFCWYLTTRGSKYWQSNWEKIAEQLETSCHHYSYQCYPIENSKFSDILQERRYSVSKANTLLALVISILCCLEGIRLSFCMNNCFVFLCFLFCSFWAEKNLLGDPNKEKNEEVKASLYAKLASEYSCMNEKNLIVINNKSNIWFEVKFDGSSFCCISSCSTIKFYQDNADKMMKIIQSSVLDEKFALFRKDSVSIALERCNINVGVDDIFNKIKSRIENINRILEK